ncbi:NAD(P)H-dependent glycerol-3-phosphate dehydrogenase [Ferruginivarius sediminum]|uniref:Glycerol-3-phosphate dehydrogenase [NAD(P)+] n=1 Tax=Ferruginivarius sediminum TaxID=2661937 RepID=A0A369TDJ1_9PROT|nr:NAD(P)H-dependent glycerol-3-phosphate dehydrogenase [Ferruginivarius sediminum]RDD63393.1 NAD(P)-dependent glycerol-3-phosphate dehydrogenase [Ferruginivarius sediminum]
MQTIAVIGAGAWGTALATTVRRAGRDTVLWAREPEVARQIAEEHENTAFLPGIALDPAIRATDDLEAAAREGEALLLAVPAQHLRETAARLGETLEAPRPLVICAKGIEVGSGRLMSEVVTETLPGWPVAVLSGPTFAAEVARGLPTAAALATKDANLGERLVAALGSRSFRPYLGDDPIGAQIGGAVKNVVAIACGIVAGRRLGENARAALITRGLAEIARLGAAKGARAETLRGLSGLGDLTLTCTGPASRNYSLGIALGEGRSKDEILGERRSVAEGVYSAEAVVALAHKLGVDMPISQAVDDVLNRDADIDAAIEGLLARPFRAEQA